MEESRTEQKPLNIISVGAGVQSTTICLMVEKGELPMVDAGIFADTMNEPLAVITHLHWLKRQCSFPIYTVTAGDLKADVLDALQGKVKRASNPPFFVLQDNNGHRGGMLGRDCTRDYKVYPIRRKVRELAKGRKVRLWMGISLDEAHRMKPSAVRYIENYYPLIDLRMTRGDCLAWMERHGYPQPPKSACFFCPYTSDERWADIKKNHYGEWARAIQFDDALRSQRVNKLAAGIKGEIFVHRSMKPLRDVEFSHETQADLFGNECEGMCGV